MTKFIQTTRGWINLAVVARATYDRDGRYNLFDAHGESLGSCSDYSFDPRDTQIGVVPSAGIVAICISTDRSDGERPTPADVWVAQIPVIAWRLIGDGFAEPVALESLSGWTAVVFECPDGRYLEPENASYPSLDDAKTAALERAQRRWDDEHRATARPA